MTGCLAYIMLLTAVALRCSCFKTIKLHKIPSGHSILKPRSLYIRSSIQGNVEIADDVIWSLELRIVGSNAELENDVKLHCQVDANDEILDIQVFQQTQTLVETPPKMLVTADIILKGPGYLIMPGSNIIFKRNSTGRTFLHKWSGYKAVIEEYEAPAVNQLVDISQPCYSTCATACDGPSGICLPCQRGFEFDPMKSQMDQNACRDIDECKIGKHSCPINTFCENAIGGYKCKCKEGYFGDGMICKVCRSCPSGWYEFSPCDATHDTVCKECRSPCEGYLYEVHPCGMGYDRYCEDILKGLRPMDVSEIIKTKKDLHGSQLVPFVGLESFIVTDDRMRAESATVRLKFAKNEDRKTVIWRTSYLQIELKLTQLNILPIYMDTEPFTSGQDRFFEKFLGLSEVKNNYCRHPAPDKYVLKHSMVSDYEAQVKQGVCTRNRKELCPDESAFGETYARRVALPCGRNRGKELYNSNLHCSTYVNLATVFGASKYKFKDPPPWNFNDKSCRYLYAACNSCKRNKCTGRRATLSCERQCEYICRCFREKHCVKAAVKCASGDISEWKLSPKFFGRDLSGRFNCLLERKIPERLFALSYRVKIPNTKLSSSWIHVNQRQNAKGKHAFKIGDFDLKFEKNSALSENIIITGHRSSDESTTRYEVRNLQQLTQGDFKGGANEVEFAAVKAFSSPPRDWSNLANCKVLSFWEKHLAKAEYPLQGALVEKLEKSGHRNVYRVRHNQHSTTMNISLPNSKSVLRELGKKSLISMFNSTLRANSTHWVLHLKANFTNCPAYFEVTIIERTKMVMVLKQDILVLCPLKYFHVVAVVPKDIFHPIHKARLFIAYVSNGANVYEAHMEKRTEVKVENDFAFRKEQSKQGKKKHLDLGILSKFDPIVILTGVFVLGLIAIIIFSCLVKPDKKKKARQKGYQHAAMQIGQTDNVREQLDNEDKLQAKQLVPIVFLVAVRVAYSFLLTVSFIVIVFSIVNKAELDAIQDFREFVDLKINQSKQISLALDQFRESEARIMTDKAAFLECACDYHMGKIMRNMRDNMTAIVQLHDIITFDKVSEALMRYMLQRSAALRAVHSKFHRFKHKVTNSMQNIERRLRGYSRRIYGNKWFKIGRAMFGAWNDFRAIDFLGSIGVFDSASFHRLKARIMGALRNLQGMLSIDAIIKRLKQPLYPIANALLAPIRNMKRRVKEAVKHRIDELKDKILKNIPCIGNIDMKKWQRYDDDYDEVSKNRCRLQTANKFVEKVVGDAKAAKKDSGDFVIRSVRDDASFNIIEGDAAEEEYEERQKSRLEALKKVSEYYKPSGDAMVALRLLRKHSVILVLVFDALLITYRSLKTYRFAFMMASGYEMTKEHNKIGDQFSGNDDNRRSPGRKMVDCVAKSIGFFFKAFTFVLKLIFTTLVIPILVIIVGALVIFYLAMAFTYNGLNVDTLEKLGTFKFLSARLDLNFNVTGQSLKERAEYLNKFDLGMYKETIRVQTKEFRNTVEEFNADEIIRIERMRAELCDIDSHGSCNIDFRKLMEKLEMNVKPCMFPVIKARMPDNIYDSEAYRRQLKYELKHYVDSFRMIIIRTFYIIMGIIATIILTVIMSKVIFKFLKKMGMIRIRKKHVYHEIPYSLRQRYKENLQ